MIKIGLVVILLLALSMNSSYANLKWPDTDAVLDNEEAILATPPEQISEEQFYVCFQGMAFGYSGSGGYFLTQEHIDWIEKMERHFSSQGITLKDAELRELVLDGSKENIKRANLSHETAPADQ